MLLFLSLIGIFLSIILLYFSSAVFKSSVYLSLFFLTLSFYGWMQWVIVYSNNSLLISIFYINCGFIAYLTGPFLYWYIRSILTDNYRLKPIDFIHLLPMLIFIAVSLPYILTPYEFKLSIASKIASNITNLGTEKPELIHIPVQAIFISRPVLLLAYCLYTLFMFVSHTKKMKDSLFLQQHQFMSKWLTVFFGFLTVLIVSHLTLLLITFQLDDDRFFFTLNLLQITSAMGLTGLLISPFFFPEILYGMPQLPADKSIVIDKQVSVEHERKVQFYLEDEYLRYLGLMISNCMVEKSPYLQSDFNLPQLSVMLKIPVHHLSFYFREELKQSFNDYRNEWRIKHAKKLIEEGRAIGLTLEAIGMMSGFLTRNTFFTAFKKFEGISPGSYVERAERLKTKPHL